MSTADTSGVTPPGQRQLRSVRAARSVMLALGSALALLLFRLLFMVPPVAALGLVTLELGDMVLVSLALGEVLGVVPGVVLGVVVVVALGTVPGVALGTVPGVATALASGVLPMLVSEFVPIAAARFGSWGSRVVLSVLVWA